jgi:CBS domain-containing protein
VSRIEPPAFGSEIFDLTMKGLEAGLKVGDIATYRFYSCEIYHDAAEVMGRADLLQFDCIPVRNGERVVGVLERNGEFASGPARDAMRRLDDGLLVSSDEPLKGFIPLLVESPHRLVVRGARIEGIVTRSDVHKLPVRLLAFALVTHLEMTMAGVILGRSERDDWIGSLSDGRRDKVMEKFDELRTENFDPPLIEMTDFADKRSVLAKMGVLDSPSKSKAVEAFERIEDLRNKVAHAGTYVETQPQFGEFVETLQLTETWIGRLSDVSPLTATSGLSSRPG